MSGALTAETLLAKLDDNGTSFLEARNISAVLVIVLVMTRLLITSFVGPNAFDLIDYYSVSP